jgi:hypothetical protein
MSVRYVVVAAKDLVRLGARVENVLADEHEVVTWTMEELEERRKELGSDVGIVAVGPALADRLGRDRVTIEYDNDGVVWGRIGNASVIWNHPSKEPMLKRMQRIDRILDEVGTEAKRLGEAAEAAGGSGSGGRLARRFLRREHKPDPRETMQMSDGMQFTMDRILWEKEYTAAVARYLLDGFPRLHLDLLRASSKRALSKLKSD